MNANELMIGDWVHVEAHRGFNAQNVKVETIPDNDGDNEYGHHYGHIGAWLEGGDNDFRDVEARHLQPIPLTAEILEKNGFKFKENGFGLYSYRLVDGNDKVYLNGTFTELEYTNVCRNYDDPDEVNYGSNMEFPKPLELHQLQNVLRVLGIEKEIIL